MKTTINQVCKFSALTVLCVCWLSVDSVSARETPAFTPTVSGNKYNFPSQRVTSANASNLLFRAGAAGEVFIGGGGLLSIPGAGSVPVVVSQKISKAAVASALGRFAVKGIGAVSPLGPLLLGVALFDFAKELGYHVEAGPDGKPVFSQISEGFVCNVANWPTPTYPPSQANATKICMPTAVSGQYAYGYSYSSSQFGWPGVTFPCGNSNCATGFVWSPIATTTGTKTTTSNPRTSEDFVQSFQQRPTFDPATTALPRLVRDMANAGENFDPVPDTLTGPVTVPLQPTVTTNPDGSTTTKDRSVSIAYGPESATVTETETTTDVKPPENPASAPTTTVTTTTKPSDLPDIKTCGYPGGPKCAIDETGTSQPVPSTKYDTSIDAYKQTADANRSVIAGAADKPFFTGWAVFFNAPPVAECVPYALPQFNGQSMGAIDPCGVVGGVRVAMAYIWALAGLYLSLGMIRRVA